MTRGWKRVNAGTRVSLCIPRNLSPSSQQPVDSAVTAWESDDLSVLVDTGPFADRLDSPSTRAYSSEIVQGIPIRVVGFEDDDGATVVAAHVPSALSTVETPRVPVTLMVRARPGTDPEIPFRVIRSLRLSE